MSFHLGSHLATLSKTWLLTHAPIPREGPHSSWGVPSRC